MIPEDDPLADFLNHLRQWYGWRGISFIDTTATPQPTKEERIESWLEKQLRAFRSDIDEILGVLPDCLEDDPGDLIKMGGKATIDAVLNDRCYRIVVTRMTPEEIADEEEANTPTCTPPSEDDDGEYDDTFVEEWE